VFQPRIWLTLFVVSAAAVVLSLPSCARSVPSGDRLALSGRVTWKGEALESGSIHFVSPTYQAGGPIRGGSYAISREFGLPPGKYTVTISRVLDQPAPRRTAPGPEHMEQQGVEQLPREFSEVGAHTIEVKAAGQNRFDFDIP
jgi:hypothetical protein